MEPFASAPTAPLHYVFAHPRFRRLEREGDVYQVYAVLAHAPIGEGTLEEAVAEAADFLQVHDDEAPARERARAWTAL